MDSDPHFFMRIRNVDWLFAYDDCMINIAKLCALQWLNLYVSCINKTHVMHMYTYTCKYIHENV